MKKQLILLLFPLFMFAQDSTLIGDVDCSGEVNSQDASLILQFVTNVIDSLPCEANMTGLTPDQLQEMIDMMEVQLSVNYTLGSSFGDYQSFQSIYTETNDTIQVSQDGILFGSVFDYDGNDGDYYVKVDSTIFFNNNDPEIYLWGKVDSYGRDNFTIPIKKNYYYNLTLNSCAIDRLYWMPLDTDLSSSESLDSTMIADMIQSALSNSVSIGIGDYYQGGIVGYIFQPGDADYILGETHGYILYSEGNQMEWGCAGLTTNIVNNNVGQGSNNTQTLATLCTEGVFAAKWCDDLVVGPYNDWFLPNYGEASLVSEGFYAKNLGPIGENSQNDIWFWLSEEYNVSNPYNYACSTCPDHAFILRDQWNPTNTAQNIEPKSKSSNQRIIAFRQF